MSSEVEVCLKWVVIRFHLKQLMLASRAAFINSKMEFSTTIKVVGKASFSGNS